MTPDYATYVLFNASNFEGGQFNTIRILIVFVRIFIKVGETKKLFLG
jgi:hypothetical protein